MGIVKSILTKPIRSFNVENRAHKIISQEKPKVAPYHPSVHKQIKLAKEVNPNFMKDHYKKDQELYDRLKKVFILSHEEELPEGTQSSNRILPQSTRTPEMFEYGYWEPNQAPEGSCYLKDALQFMAKYISDPKNHSTKTIAEQYKLSIKDVDDILKYYRVFQLINPEDGEARKNIKIPKIQVQEIEPKFPSVYR